MEHSARRLIRIVALLSVSGLCLGNSCDSSTNTPPPNMGGSGGSGGSGAGGTAGIGGAGGTSMGNPIAGTYTELFSCQLNNPPPDPGTCLEDNVRIMMDVIDLGGGQYRIEDLGSNSVATGTRTGDVLEWTNMDPDFPGFSETGTWVFTFAAGSTTFVKNSTFMQDQGSQGECKGNGRLASEGEPASVDPFNPPCTPQ